MKKIFIIDDDDMYQMILKRVVKKAGPDIETESFWNGALAIDALSSLIANNKRFPDAIFVDINMPVSDGWQFLEELELLRPGVGAEIKLYMMSTSLDINDKEKALGNKNITDYFSKPITLPTLQQVFREL